MSLCSARAHCSRPNSHRLDRVKAQFVTIVLTARVREAEVRSSLSCVTELRLHVCVCVCDVVTEEISAERHRTTISFALERLGVWTSSAQNRFVWHSRCGAGIV